ncbi:PAS domain S-box protein [Parapusillimonas sp. SGNA-6]|nr:PAS domain S-box protein [Parapusillimonas sp. SGNA-6]
MPRELSFRPTAESLTDGRRFELLVHAIKDFAIYLVDANGYVTSWNTGAERLKGYKSSEVMGQHFSRFFTPEDREAGVPETALRTARERGTYEGEGWRVRKDGSLFWTTTVMDPIEDDDGAIIGFANVIRDMSAEKAAQEALYESEQRFKLLVQGVHDYAIYMLDPTGHITNWNAGAAAIKGYTEEEVLGRHFSCFYTEEDRQKGEPERALATALQFDTFQNEAWRVRKDGTRFWASVVIDPIRDEHGKLLGFAKITRDVTERKLAQDELDRTREAISQSQKLEAIGRLTGGVAHDFNNLLTIIRSSAELLRHAHLPEEKRSRYIEAIAETAERAAVLTRQLLAFARQQPLRPEAFHVGARVAGIREMIEASLGATIQFDLDIPDDLPLVEADVNQFEAALLNMVINARDAMGDGGTLRVGARYVTRIPPIRQHAGTMGEFIAVTISDTGPGIDATVLGRVFEPFFTTKQANKGTGLGLSQVYGFAKQSGGEIDVSSQAGAGTTFTLYLPRAKVGATRPQHRNPSHKLPDVIQPRNVLLVEDNETVGQFALGLLTELGHNVTLVTDAQAALKEVRERAQRLDIVLTDVVMPGMSGIELAHEIRQKWPGLCVVLTSGYSHILAEEGSHGFFLLEKPYSMEGLLTVIREACGEISSQQDDKQAAGG